MTYGAMEIVSPGLMTTVQDLGRRGYQRLGVPVAGAMDTFALRIANILVGNREDAAGLEVTVLGPTIRFLVDTTISLAGADLGAHLDGVSIPPWRSVTVKAGGVLGFRGTQEGVRAYIAVAGGLDVPLVMGSRSTYLKGSFGGHDGRALTDGDVLDILPPNAPRGPNGTELAPELTPASYGHEHQVRVVLGPQDDAFSSRGLSTFLSAQYSISIQSDRMGYRLDGPKVEHVDRADIVSDAIALGSVQITGDGSPIILLADRGTTGGYTKIATVIGADLSYLAQAMPGDTIQFSSISQDDARDILLGQERLIAEIKRSVGLDNSGLFGLAAEGEVHRVVSDEGYPITCQPTPSGYSEIVAASASGYEFEIEVRTN